jgi:nucleotide-binding universal stress UspA family protein
MYKKIMVPLDGSELAECVFPHLETIAKGCQPPPEVIVVQAVEPISVPYGMEVLEFSSLKQVEAFETHQKTGAKKYLKQVVARLKQNGIKARAELIYGKAGEALSDYAVKNKVDLVIIATHGRSGISRWVFGSVANRIVHSAGVPVLMVRAPGWGPAG